MQLSADVGGLLALCVTTGRAVAPHLRLCLFLHSVPMNHGWICAFKEFEILMFGSLRVQL